MRQVGDRLIPVGISSGRVHALAPEDGQGENAEGGSAEPGGGRSRRSRRRQQNQDLNQILGTMGLGGQDLEEVCGRDFLLSVRIYPYTIVRLNDMNKYSLAGPRVSPRTCIVLWLDISV